MVRRTSALPRPLLAQAMAKAIARALLEAADELERVPPASPPNATPEHGSAGDEPGAPDTPPSGVRILAP